ncbi:MAG: hypothetical protein H0V24_08775 [Chloroflexia bacterium]|nr:hypothetical protein [Chloroflexia bacterium]
MIEAQELADLMAEHAWYIYELSVLGLFLYHIVNFFFLIDSGSKGFLGALIHEALSYLVVLAAFGLLIEEEPYWGVGPVLLLVVRFAIHPRASGIAVLILTIIQGVANYDTFMSQIREWLP